MTASKTAKASRLYLDGKFAEALAIYRELAADIGQDFFHANIALCRRRLDPREHAAAPSPEAISLAFITDETYLMPTYVAIYSLIRNRDPARTYDIHVILSEVGGGAKALLEGLAVAGVRIQTISSSVDFSRYRITKNGFHVSPTAILKFELPQILPDLDKVLYLDGDILVRSDLVKLFETDIRGSYAAVVEDIKPKLRYKPSILSKLDIEGHRGYFNSGVMLLNLSAMRRDKITEALFEYRENGINFFMDQDALNVVFRDQVKFLSWQNNLLVTLAADFTVEEIVGEYGTGGSYGTFDDMAASSQILHFASKQKPWKDSKAALSYLWNEYYLSSTAASTDFTVGHPVKDQGHFDDVVVSLTSYPARIHQVQHTIQSLLSQAFKASAVVLWLAREQFPNGDADLPPDLLALRAKGLTIDWCNDIKSFKKLIPSLRKYPRSVIVTADDDILYEKDWLARLVASYMATPDAIHCCRAHKARVDDSGALLPYKRWPREIQSTEAAFDHFFTGCGGVLYPPDSLDARVLNEQLFTAICPFGDDIWFWGMALLKGTRIKVIGREKFKLNFVENSQDVALWKENDQGGRNDVMLGQLIDAFPEIRSLLIEREAVAV